MVGLLTVVTIATCIALGEPSAVYFGCSAPHSPQYGGYSPKQYFYSIGSTIKFHCDDGYQVHGASWTVCIYNIKAGKGSWIHKPPLCKRKLMKYTIYCILCLSLIHI